MAKIKNIRNKRKSSPFVMRANPAGSKSPFRGQGSSLTRKQVLEEMIIHEQQQEIPQLFYSSALQGIISRCLDKNPKNRPSAEELLMLIPKEETKKKKESKTKNSRNFILTMDGGGNNSPAANIS